VTLTHLSTSQFPEQGVFRVSRREDPLSFSRINVADAELSQAGNRFDVPGGAVLYCSSTLKGSFAETFAHFRPSPAVVAALSAEPNSTHMNPGSVPTDWRLQRVKLRVTCVDPLPFLDAEHPRTIAALNKYLAKDLVAIGADEPLDVSMVRGRNRQLTRLISRWAYVQQDDQGTPLFSGLRYVSKLGDWECWAIYDGTDIRSSDISAITSSDVDLLEIADLFGLMVH
jgi:hypothetical protein